MGLAGGESQHSENRGPEEEAQNRSGSASKGTLRYPGALGHFKGDFLLLSRNSKEMKLKNKEEKWSCLFDSCLFPVVDIIQKKGHGGRDIKGRRKPDDKGAVFWGHPDVFWRPDGG